MDILRTKVPPLPFPNQSIYDLTFFQNPFHGLQVKDHIEETDIIRGRIDEHEKAMLSIGTKKIGVQLVVIILCEQPALTKILGGSIPAEILERFYLHREDLAIHRNLGVDPAGDLGRFVLDR